jgi:hypothetical protein
MRFCRKMLVLLVSLSILLGCTSRHYLGFHGPSIKLHPDVHEDDECLECHGPDSDSDGRPTSHPDFTGCLKCHNDEVKPSR